MIVNEILIILCVNYFYDYILRKYYEKNMLGINRAYFSWCEKRDLNPYGKNHTPLKRARLPVPPLSH